MLDDATWQALALVLTLLAGAWTVYAFRRRGWASGLRGVGLTLLPAAAYLTGTLRLAGRIVDAVADWATRLVFSPTVWIGVVLFVVAVVLFGLAGLVAGRTPRHREVGSGRRGRSLPGNRTAERPGGPPVDDDLAEIEEILKRRGIS